MILDFTKELAELDRAMSKMDRSLILAEIYSKGMAAERKRVLDIIARKALNASELRAAINRPVR